MLGKLVGNIVTAPLRIVNAGGKVCKAGLDAMCGERVRFEENAADKIADGAQKEIEKIFGEARHD